MKPRAARFASAGRRAPAAAANGEYVPLPIPAPAAASRKVTRKKARTAGPGLFAAFK